MDKATKQGVPKSLFVLIIVILAGMFYYAAYVDKSAPEKVVQDFYQAYFDRDFETVASNLSVFWAAQLMPQYSTLTPAQLLEKRDEVEKDIATTISAMEENNKIPKNLSIEIMKDYTKLGKNSAIVAYSFKQDGKSAGMEAAILIKEKGQLRIFNLSPINEQNLQQIKTLDIKTLDKNFAQLTGSKSDSTK
ncbi:MAG: hypothetical protein ABFC94_17620 [Syntrophomonas sp.]